MLAFGALGALSTFSLLILFAVDCNALRLPTDTHLFRSVQFTSDICTTNISIPTPTEQCILACQPIRDAQVRCEDHFLCMCHHAPVSSLQSCLDCVLDAVGDFALLVPEYISKSANDVLKYASVCDTVSQSSSSDDISSDMSTINTNHTRTEPPSAAVLQYCSATDEVTKLPLSDDSLGHYQPFYTLFPILSLVVAFTLLLVVNRWRK